MTQPEQNRIDPDLPFAVTRRDPLGIFLTGCNRKARALGLRPTMRLTDARASVPELVTRTANPEAERQLLQEMARFGERYAPWIAIDDSDPAQGDGGLWLDMSGGTHLFGGEKALMTDVGRSYQVFRCTRRLGLADTPAAAFAAARYAPGAGIPSLLQSGATRQAVAGFPLDALRLVPATIRVLNRLGFRQIGDLYPVPRASMTIRFGPDVMLRLDQILGRHREHLAFEHSPRIYEVGHVWPEPLGTADSIERAVQVLLWRLCQTLRGNGIGLRRLGLRFQRVNNMTVSLISATSAPCQDETHLMRLLRDRLPGVDAGFGIEAIQIRAFQTQRLCPEQGSLTDLPDDATDPDACHRLIDRLAGRLGTHSVYRFARCQSYLPERIPVRQPYPGVSPEKSDSKELPAAVPLPVPRPIRLIQPAEDIEVLSFDADKPRQVRWRRLVLQAASVQGPERLMREWWRDFHLSPWDHRSGRRDYYRFDDHQGHSLWLCRVSGKQTASRWFVQGWFEGPPP